MDESRWQDDLDRRKPWREAHQLLVDAEPKSEREALWQETARALAADAAELDRELHDLGIPFRSGELANVRAPYPEALPVLLKHLPRKHLANNEEMIIRALSVPYGGDEVFDALLEHLDRHRGEMRTDNLFALGNALAIVGNKRRAADLVRIASDEANGAARHQPLRMLAQLRHPSVERIANSFFDQNAAPLVAIEALRKAKIWSAKERVRPFVDSPIGAIRAEARRYMSGAKASPLTPSPSPRTS